MGMLAALSNEVPVIFRFLLALIGLATALAPGARAAETPRRIASANLCADQLLLELADPGQILSLSPFARDPELSWFAERAQKYPANRGSGEDIVRLDADLVLTGPYDNRYTRALLSARGLRFVALNPWTSFAQGFAEVRALADVLGHRDRGEALVARIEAALAKIDASHAKQATSLVLHRRGFVYHTGLSGEISQRAGLRDMAPEMGISGSGFVSLEALAKARPEYLLVSSADFTAMDQGQAFMVHPALRAFWPAERRLVLPDKLTICGGPSTPALIEQIIAEVDAKVK